MKSILTNTIKISAAAILAILCAQVLKLDFAVSAGIVAILSVQPTKKETLRTALARLLAFAVALAISITLFNLLGFTTPVFFLYLAIFILVCQWRKWISAMAMDSVLISHFLSFGKTGLMEIKNEVLLFIIGVGFGILVNLLLHKKTDYIEELKNQTDGQIKLVLHRLALRIQNPKLEDYDGSCFASLNQSLFTAKKQAEENYNNQFSKKDTFDSRYLEMREDQTKILYEMYKAARQLNTVPATAPLLSDFLEKVSTEYHKDNDVKALLDELAQIHDKMKGLPLPQTRTEFEDRANLFMLMERLKEFLQIKRDFMISQEIILNGVIEKYKLTRIFGPKIKTINKENSNTIDNSNNTSKSHPASLTTLSKENREKKLSIENNTLNQNIENKNEKSIRSKEKSVYVKSGLFNTLFGAKNRKNTQKINYPKKAENLFNIKENEEAKDTVGWLTPGLLYFMVAKEPREVADCIGPC